MGNAAGGWAWMSGFGWIFMILFWGLVIFGVVALAKWIFSSGDAIVGGGARPPLDILKERYARGEINRDQYEHRLPMPRGPGMPEIVKRKSTILAFPRAVRQALFVSSQRIGSPR